MSVPHWLLELPADGPALPPVSRVRGSRERLRALELSLTAGSHPANPAPTSRPETDAGTLVRAEVPAPPPPEETEVVGRGAGGAA